ncbi:MAG: heme lyase CcmF/NrfE family subunit [Arenicellales bacterium]|nr:heme lyase CcmF/NrfE family subunit [Arenicellales bacterium]MDP6918292.1 heme lyase CcmF/NrfE family subunit [Arenicellales bacterium]
MIPEIGLFSLILALLIAALQAAIPIAGATRNHPSWIAVARPAAFAQLLFVAISYGCLTAAFLSHDFSVAYVAHNSNSRLPLIYLISGVWGAHEGSLLLWALTLALWTAAVAWFSKSVPDRMVARVLGVMGIVSVGFLLFILFTSNPFERQFPPPVDGRDLNPLLQDPGLAIHPPMLYMGYVGFSVAFAFAIAALLGGRLDSAWARWSRPWTLGAWVFLTAGIALGSWWAYYELGWGGWWFWDPVENASFMPWLVGTALIHSLAATEKRGVFKAWTVLLAVFAFSLSLLGTFLVRSGVLTSVHAFATDPTRGLFILVFLAVVVGGSLALYAWRAPAVRSSGGFNLVSREAGLLLNNVLLVVSAATILLGTLYPLVIDALGLGKISVGPPYFNAVFIPLTAPLAILVGVGSMLRWKKDQLGRLVRPLGPPFALALVLGLLWPAFFGEYRLAAVFGGVLGLWTIFAALAGLWGRTRAGQRWQGLARTPGAVFGMSLAHIGLGVFVIGITLTSTYSVEKDLRMAPGETYTIGGYTFRFDGINQQRGPNYLADTGTITVLRDNQLETVLNPEKRTYLVQQMPMTEAAIDAGLTRDLYVALGEPLGDGSSWAVRLYFKPYVRWIWLGALIMVAGGLLSASDKRYRKFARETNVAPAPDTRHAAS